MSNSIDSPNYESTEYQAFLDLLALPTALMGGTAAMRAAGTTFLPQEEGETKPAYDSRVARSFLFGGFERTVGILTGEVFNNPVSVKEDAPDLIKEYSEDIDLQGKNLTRFGKQMFAPSLYNGAGFILVDTPPLPKDEEGNAFPTTAQEDAELGRRLYWTYIAAPNLLGGQVEFKNGKTSYTQVRIQEIIKEPDGLYGEEEITQIRILYPGRWEEYREEGIAGDKDKEWVLHDEGTSPLDYIPLVPFFTGTKTSEFIAKPPLTGLAELNQAHWISYSDQNNILHFVRVPFLFGKGLSKTQAGTVIISPRNLFHSDNIDADLKFVEHTGAGISDGWKDLERLEMLMSLWGLELISDHRSGNVTATERTLTGAKTGSFLNSVALDFQDCLNTAIKYSCDILRIEFTGGATVNTDFSLAFSNFDTNVLLNAYKLNVLDRGTLIDEFKRRGLINEAADAVEIAARIEEELRAVSTMGTLGGSLLQGTDL